LIEIAIRIYPINIYFSYHVFTFRISVYQFEDIILARRNAGIPFDKKNLDTVPNSVANEIYRAGSEADQEYQRACCRHSTSETVAFTRLTSILIKWLIDLLSAQERIPDAHPTMIGHVVPGNTNVFRNAAFC